MKIKPILADMSGRLQGIVASHNRGGQYFRGRTVPDTPPTAAQTAVRVFLANAVAAWHALSVSQQEIWNEYASLHPVVDGFGDSVNVGGIGMYNRTNILRQQAGLAQVATPPAPPGPAIFTPPSFDVTGAPSIDVDFDDTDAWASEDGAAMLIYASRFVPTSRFSAAGISKQLLGVILGDSGTPPTSPVTLTTPFPASANTKMFFRVRVISSTGAISSNYETTAST